MPLNFFLSIAQVSPRKMKLAVRCLKSDFKQLYNRASRSRRFAFRGTCRKSLLGLRPSGRRNFFGR